MKNRSIYILAVIICSIVLLSAPAFATIVLELHSDTTDGSATFTDSSNPARTVTTNGGVHHSTDVLDNFGGSSIFFDGTGDYLGIADHDDWAFGGGDFSIDMWVNFSSLVGSPAIITQWNAAGAFNKAFRMVYYDATSRLAFEVSSNGSNETPLYADWVPILGEWYHIANVRDGNTLRTFVNGTQINTATFTGSMHDSISELQIGILNNNLEDFYGYMDDIYIRKGEALDTNQLTSIITIGGEAFENIRGGINTTFGLGYSTAEIDQLSQLYNAGTGSVSIGDLTWSYVDDILPGDTGGTLYNVGDAYTHDGKWYIKLGSGLEGVPEVPKGAVMIIALVFGLGTACKKGFLNNSLA